MNIQRAFALYRDNTTTSSGQRSIPGCVIPRNSKHITPCRMGISPTNPTFGTVWCEGRAGLARAACQGEAVQPTPYCGIDGASASARGARTESGSNRAGMRYELLVIGFSTLIGSAFAYHLYLFAVR